MSMICVLLFLLCYFTIHRIGRKCSFGHLKGGGVSVDSHMDMSQNYWVMHLKGGGVSVDSHMDMSQTLLGHALERRCSVC